jgi:hypothetical protein
MYVLLLNRYVGPSVNCWIDMLAPSMLVDIYVGSLFTAGKICCPSLYWWINMLAHLFTNGYICRALFLMLDRYVGPPVHCWIGMLALCVLLNRYVAHPVFCWIDRLVSLYTS